jgi:ubiquinone/menaquinone biosynthesis C-methylase UbiE
VAKLLGKLTAPLRDRRVTNAVRHLLDEWLPPAVREWRPLNRWMADVFHGRAFDLDFKERAFGLSSREIAAAYEALDAGVGRYRDSDTTAAQAEAIVARALGTVLEVGCGNGVLTAQLAAAGHAIVATDVGLHSLRATRDRAAVTAVARAALPDLPFADRSFDTVVCAHTLEHIPDLYRAAAELHRVARRRVIVVVPRQRYYRYTVDYHLHFFPSAAPLEALLGGQAQAVDGDWMVVTEIPVTP